MAFEKRVKYIVFNEDWTGLAFKEHGDNTIDDFDYVIPIRFLKKETNVKKATQLPGIDLQQVQ